jgi:hypothetical protein
VRPTCVVAFAGSSREVTSASIPNVWALPSVVTHRRLVDPSSGVLILDSTGFVKQGDKPCGVFCQYTGTVGDTANAQVEVVLTYASKKGAAFVGRTGAILASMVVRLAT